MRKNEIIHLIVGNIGSGKTTLAHQAFPHAKPNCSQVKDVSFASRVLALFNGEKAIGSILRINWVKWISMILLKNL
ncbi:MAG: hypothetical protein ACWIPH_07440 [Ostreibacterium sp.]